MFTRWNQVEDWIRDNHLDKWIFTKGDRNCRKEEGGLPNDKIVDSEYYGEGLEQKLELTRKMLEQYGGRVYGYGWTGKRATDGMCCEVQLESVSSVSPVGMMPMQQQPIDRESLLRDVRAQVEAEMKAQRYEEEKKQFEKDKKEFEREKQSAVGLLIGYLKPVIGALGARNVAGVDAPHDVQAARIAPVERAEEVTVETESGDDSPFTDEEADRLFALLARFKQVEPQYLELLESVVEMAESGDSTYTMAKGFLIKK